jgi:hypothetical protein
MVPGGAPMLLSTGFLLEAGLYKAPSRSMANKTLQRRRERDEGLIVALSLTGLGKRVQIHFLCVQVFTLRGCSLHG